MEILPDDILYYISTKINAKYLHKFIKVSYSFKKIIYRNRDLLLKLLLFENYTRKLMYLEETLTEYKIKKDIDLDIYLDIYNVYKPFYENKIKNLD